MNACARSAGMRFWTERKHCGQAETVLVRNACFEGESAMFISQHALSDSAGNFAYFSRKVAQAVSLQLQALVGPMSTTVASQPQPSV